MNNEAVKILWDKAFSIAERNAQAEMGKKSTIEALSWQEVFQEDYELE